MKLFETLKKLGILKSGTGDYYSGEYNSSPKKTEEKKTESKVKKRGAPKFLLIITFLLAGIFILAGIGISISVFFAMFVIWGIVIFFVLKMSFSILVYFIIIFVMTITSFAFIPTTETIENSENEGLVSEEIDLKSDENIENDDVVKYLPGQEIYIEAETGELTKGGAYSRISESSRGEEAYLGDGGATVEYRINLDVPNTYLLSVNLNDDGVHSSGKRNATIYVNDKNIHYDHVSENTGVWKWYELGGVELKKGENTIKFMKDETTSAAYIMDAFKLSPKLK